MAFLATLNENNELATKIKNSVPFQETRHRHSSFTNRMDNLFIVSLIYATEYLKLKNMLIESHYLLSDFDIHEDNEETSKLRSSRVESFQRILALNIIPETLEKKYGISTEVTTALIEKSFETVVRVTVL